MATEVKTYKIRKTRYGNSRPGDRFYYAALCGKHKAEVELSHGIVIEIGVTEKPCALCSVFDKFKAKVRNK